MKQLLLLVLMTSLFATGGYAHSGVEDTTPANAATVKAVEVIEMRFDEPMRVTAITLTGEDGAIEIKRETGMDAVTEFRALPTVALPAGVYTVDWRGLSTDGHPMQGMFGFTVAP